MHHISGSGYDCATHHNNGANNTWALDFDFALNTPVTAATSGQVTVRTETVGGNIVEINHGGNWRTLYAHLNSFSVIQNQWVNQGQTIGLSGSTGTGSSGPHLHYALLDRQDVSHPPEPMYGPYRGGNRNFGGFGVGTANGSSCSGVVSPGYTSQPGCSSGSSQTVFPRATTNGYYSVAFDGGIFAFGGAPFRGSMGGQPLNSMMVGMARTYDNQGYWTVGADGGIFAFNAPFNGSAGGINLQKCIQGMAARSNGGYWLVAADGGIFAYNAPFYGSMGGQPLAARIQGMAPTPDGGGYWEVGADGGVFAFGNAQFFGSLAGQATAPVTSIASTPSGHGYWIVQANGIVVGFGDAANLGSWAQPDSPVIAITPTVNGDGYWLVASNGVQENFGNADALGGGLFGFLSQPISGSAGLHGRPPGLTPMATPSTIIVPPGTSQTVTVSVTANPYFQGVASLSASGNPSGVSVSFNPSSLSLNQNQSGTSTLTITRSLTQLSTFTLTVNACGNGVCGSTTVSVR